MILTSCNRFKFVPSKSHPILSLPLKYIFFFFVFFYLIIAREATVSRNAGWAYDPAAISLIIPAAVPRRSSISDTLGLTKRAV